MINKSLFLGTAAAASLALLMLFTFVGCSNPSSSDTEYVTQAGSEYPFPPDTVMVGTRAALEGLLNDYNADTNKVQHIAYDGDDASLAADLVIPAGKTVYFLTDYLTDPIDGNITVQPGAKLVLVNDFLAGAGTNALGADSGYLLVKGTLEVFKTLEVATDARDVSDYTVENVIEPGRNTVIGKNVIVLPGASLVLKNVDIIPPDQNSENKFTPAQAWAAAGQGNLEIDTALDSYPYTVKELLTGVAPSWNRRYIVQRGGVVTTETLPALIPAGAVIATNAIPADSDGHTLTVNGWLTTGGTLNAITAIEVGPGGSLDLNQPSGDVLEKLTALTLKAGAGFTVSVTQTVTLQSLKSLFLGDGSTFDVAQGDRVSFTQVPDEKLETTLGLKVFYSVGTAADAVLDVKITDNASLINGSTLTVNAVSTFTLAEGKTLTVEDGAAVDFSALAPADDAPILIAGKLVVEEGGSFVGPDLSTFAGDLATIFKVINLAPETGKVVLDWGAAFTLGSGAGATAYVGPYSTPATYEWVASNTDGAQIELNAAGLVIRDIDGGNDAVVAVGSPHAGVLKNQSLTVETGATLDVGTGQSFWLIGDTEANGGGAVLKGGGQVTVGKTTISGGAAGWQAEGDTIAFVGVSANAALLKSATASATVTTPTAILRAKGPNATIAQADGASNNLTIDENTTIALGGTASKQAGAIILAGNATPANAGTITLTKDTSKITTGNSTPTTAATFTEELATDGVTEITTGAGVIGITNVLGDGTNAKVTTTAVLNTTNNNLLPAGKLVSLQGDATAGTVKGGGTGTTGYISSETNTNLDNTI
jgi:hypothetical protein